MHLLETSPSLRKVTAGHAGAKGRGVFAIAQISRGEIIDECCTLDLDEAQCAAIEQTLAGDHYFAHPADPSRGLLVLGLASLCNHAAGNNAETAIRFEHGLGWIVRLTALRDIAAGEEITRFYACPPWFEVSA